MTTPTFLLQFTSVFVAMVAADACWAKYMRYVAEGHATKAATWSAAIILVGAVAVVSYVNDHRLLIAAVLGAWVGTYLAVRRSPK